MIRVTKEQFQASTSFMIRNGLIFSIASVVANALNLIFNLYLGVKLSLTDFSLVALFMGLLYGLQVFTNGLSVATHRTVVLTGMVGWLPQIVKKCAFFAAIWLFLTPILAHVWVINEIALASFALVVFFMPLIAYMRGFSLGNDAYGVAGGVFVFESAIRLLLALLFVLIGWSAYTYASIPLSFLATFIFATLLWRTGKTPVSIWRHVEESPFDIKFFFYSVVLGISTLVYLSFDIILARTFLNEVEAGAYALLTLLGKVLFFTASLFGVVIISGVGRSVREGQATQPVLYVVLAVVGVILVTFLSVMYWFGEWLLLTFFGAKAMAIIPFMMLYLLAISLFAIIHTVTLYHHTLGRYKVTHTVCLMSLIFPLYIALTPPSLAGFIEGMFLTAFLSLTALFFIIGFSNHN